MMLRVNLKKVSNRNVVDMSYKVVMPNVEDFLNRGVKMSTNIPDCLRVVQRSNIFIGMFTTI